MDPNLSGNHWFSTTVHLVSIQIHHPDESYDNPRSYFLIRWPSGDYTYQVVHDPSIPYHPELRALRCICPSPWDAKEIFVGGFDCNKKLSHNTAWIMKGSFLSQLDDVPAINPEKIQLVEEFKNTLLDAGVQASCYYAPEKSHNEIALALGNPDDPVGQAFLQFLHQYNKK